MAIKVKGAADSASKWSDNASRAASAAVAGAIAAAGDWASNTANASDNYKMGVTAPGIETRFRTGVTKAGAQKFAAKVQALSASRLPSGVSAGKGDYQANVEPYLQTISGLTLPAAGPRGDARNYERSVAVGKALNAKRLATMGV